GQALEDDVAEQAGLELHAPDGDIAQIVDASEVRGVHDEDDFRVLVADGRGIAWGRGTAPVPVVGPQRVEVAEPEVLRRGQPVFEGFELNSPAGGPPAGR